MKNIKKDLLPGKVKEGSAIIFTGGKWQLDKKRAKSLEAEINELAKDLFE
jgi:hypothetical protein